jgi:hemerythrin-like domain-containing protein
LVIGPPSADTAEAGQGAACETIAACHGATTKGTAMNFRALMLAGHTKANELFDRLAETTDGAVKTREKLFSELKGELELHISLEEQHLFPIFRRNAETKDLVPGAIKDNKELRTKLAELEGLPKNDETFSERLKALQKAFRQHARDEKRELLPAVQRALSEEQVQNVAEKIEAGLAEADQARHNELEARRAKMRQDREQSERHAEQQETAERAKQAATGQSRQADSDAAIDHARDETQDRPRDSAEAVERIATAAQTNVFQMAKGDTQRAGNEVRSAADTNSEALQTVAPKSQVAASLPGVAAEFPAVWVEWMGQSAVAGAQITQDVLRQVAMQQHFAANAMQGWMEQNARVMRMTMHMTQTSLHHFVNCFTVRSSRRENSR